MVYAGQRIVFREMKCLKSSQFVMKEKWKIVNKGKDSSLENRSIKFDGKVRENEYDIANCLANHFPRVDSDNTNTTVDDNDFGTVGTTIINSIYFQPVSFLEVLKIIRNLKTVIPLDSTFCQ